MLPSIFVLYEGDMPHIIRMYNVNLMYLRMHGPSDADFILVETICLAFFLAEFFANTWSKSTIVSWWPFVKKGYIFSFFWFCDVVSIVSLFPDIPAISTGMGISKFPLNTRVIRVIRLVRLIRLYKIYAEKVRRTKQEEELLELVRTGAISYDEIEGRRALYNDRQSKLGAQLSDAITQKVIILIMVMMIIVEAVLLPPQDVVNNGPMFAFGLLHQLNVDQITGNISTASFTQFRDEMIGDVSTADGANYIIYLSYNLTQGPFINDIGRLLSIRPEALVPYTFSTSLPQPYNEVVSTTVLINNIATVRAGSQWSIITTIFVGACLIIGAVVFTDDAQR
jgi:hypothetical protein